MSISDALIEIVASLNDAGIYATAEPASMELPGAIVLPGVIEFNRLAGFDMTFEIYLVTKQHRTQAEVMDDLQELLEKFRTVYQIPDAQPVALPQTTGSPLPALLINLTANIT